jgi:hypothetical protein
MESTPAMKRFPKYDIPMTECLTVAVTTLLSTTCIDRTMDEINPYKTARSGSLAIVEFEVRENEGATPTKKPRVTTKAESKT